MCCRRYWDGHYHWLWGLCLVRTFYRYGIQYLIGLKKSLLFLEKCIGLLISLILLRKYQYQEPTEERNIEGF